jgi:hypothetical protein
MFVSTDFSGKVCRVTANGDLLTQSSDSAKLNEDGRAPYSALGRRPTLRAMMNSDPKNQNVGALAPPTDVDEQRRERRTGPRVKEGYLEAGPLQASPQLLLDDESQITLDGGHSSVSTRPAAFRKPFASLPPTSLPGGALSSNGLPLLLDDQSSPSFRTASLSSGPASKVSVRPKNAQTYCNRHRLAKNPQGQCMLCEREASRARGGGSAEALHWKLPVVLMAVAVVVGAAMAAWM